MTTIVTPAAPVLLDPAEEIIGKLEAAGIRATIDIKELNPPGCYLSPPELEFRFRQGDFTATYTLLVCAPNTTRRLQYAAMSSLLFAVQRALGERSPTARPVDVPTNDGTAVLLGYELSWHERVRQPSPTNKEIS
jgi:hypothetical protein